MKCKARDISTPVPSEVMQAHGNKLFATPKHMFLLHTSKTEAACSNRSNRLCSDKLRCFRYSTSASMPSASACLRMRLLRALSLHAVGAVMTIQVGDDAC